MKSVQTRQYNLLHAYIAYILIDQCVRSTTYIFILDKNCKVFLAYLASLHSLNITPALNHTSVKVVMLILF